MNEYEIDECVERVERHAPQFLPYARFLADWRDTINENSDGWPYWKIGRNSAKKLMSLLDRTIAALREGGEMPTEAEFKKSLAPIRAAAKKYNLPVPELRENMPAGPRM